MEVAYFLCCKASMAGVEFSNFDPPQIRLESQHPNWDPIFFRREPLCQRDPITSYRIKAELPIGNVMSDQDGMRSSEGL